MTEESAIHDTLGEELIRISLCNNGVSLELRHEGPIPRGYVLLGSVLKDYTLREARNYLTMSQEQIDGLCELMRLLEASGEQYPVIGAIEAAGAIQSRDATPQDPMYR